MTGRTGATSWDLFEAARGAQSELLRTSRMYAQRLSQVGQQYQFGMSSPVWVPAVDISEREDAYVVAVELPGVEIGDIEITFEDGSLIIQGHRRVAHDPFEERMHRAERHYGAFRRSITLPSPMNPDAIEASTQGGVLQIVVPKSAEVHTTRTQVRIGSGHALPTAG